LPHEVNDGYSGTRDLIVLKVNGVEVKNLKHLVQMIEQNTEPFIRLDLSKDFVIGFKPREAEEANKEIVQIYNLPLLKSPSLNI
jgi:hypothetical protein